MHSQLKISQKLLILSQVVSKETKSLYYGVKVFDEYPANVMEVGEAHITSQVRSVSLHGQLKVKLHSIRFSYVFVRFFTFLLLLDKVCAFSSAFL